MNNIEISKSNYQEFSSLDIVAFSFASPGAMGEGGGIYMITSDKKIYHTNFVTGDMTFEDVFTVCPPLRECRFGVFGAVATPLEWSTRYMGFGNHLVVRNDLMELTREKIDQLEKHELYQQWKEIIINVELKEQTDKAQTESDTRSTI